MGAFPNKNIKLRVLISLLISIFFFLWILPISNYSANDAIRYDGVLDGSWKIGLNMINVNNLQLGSDINFTYGPLYFLSDNTLVAINWNLYIMANILIVLLWILTFFLIIFFILEKLSFQNLKDKIISHIIIILSLYSLFNIRIKLTEFILLLIILLLFNIVEKNYTNRKMVSWSIAIGFLLSVISLVKFYYFYVAFAIIAISIIIFAILKKHRVYISIIGSYLAFLILIWIITQKAILTLYQFIKNGLFLSMAFSENQQFFFEDWQGSYIAEGRFILFYALFVFALWAFIFVLSIVKKERKILFFSIITFPIIFMVYKQGFTRMDSFHSQEYFRFIIFLLIIAIIIISKKFWKIVPIFIILILIAIPFRTTDEILSVRYKLSSNFYEIKRVVDRINPQRFEVRKQSEIEGLKDPETYYFVYYEDLIQRIKPTDTIDIIPFEVVVPYIYNLNWNPRPVFQSYTVYNKKLNEINANHFDSVTAPEKIIYRLAAIDGRYPLFDEPLVLKTLLKNYDLSYINGADFGFLEKREVFKDYSILELNKNTFNFNEKISIPDERDGLVFCKINIDQNLFGRIKSFFYKGGYIWINIYLNNPEGEVIKYRMLRENANLGLYIGSYIKNMQDLKNVFDSNYSDLNKENKIKYIELSTNDNYSYGNTFNVEFDKITYK